jgi:hypothetical protein
VGQRLNRQAVPHGARGVVSYPCQLRAAPAPDVAAPQPASDLPCVWGGADLNADTAHLAAAPSTPRPGVVGLGGRAPHLPRDEWLYAGAAVVRQRGANGENGDFCCTASPLPPLFTLAFSFNLLKSLCRGKRGKRGKLYIHMRKFIYRKKYRDKGATAPASPAPSSGACAIGSFEPHHAWVIRVHGWSGFQSAQGAWALGCGCCSTMARAPPFLSFTSDLNFKRRRHDRI